MSTTTGTALFEVPRGREDDLAVALGLARDDVPALRLPSLARKAVPGMSPLEASGWATGTEVGSGQQPVR